MTEEPRAPEESGADSLEAITAADDAEELEHADQIPADAFYSPDDPIADAEGSIPDDAIFSPDDPLTRSTDGEGVVTSMGGDRDRSFGKGRGLAWEIRRTATLMERLGKDLRDHGMEALRVHPETEPMDALLRSFVAGYLVGQTEEDR